MTSVASPKVLVANSKIKKWPAILLTISFMLSVACNVKATPMIFATYGKTMGTTYSVKWVAETESVDIKAEIKADLQQVNQQMSTYIKDSELSKFNRLPIGESVTLSEPLAKVLWLAKEINRHTDGAFDVTVGPLVNLWGFGATGRHSKVPTDAEIEALKKKIGSDFIKLEGTTASRQQDIYVDLSAIAKGYAVDSLANLLESKNIYSYLVEIGGELRANGKKPNGAEWRIAIETPKSSVLKSIQKIIGVNNIAVATSGDYRNYFEENGLRFSHTIDPVTARPIRHNLVSVTVLMPTCIEADALATAMMVMGVDKAMRFAEDKGIAVFLISKTADGFAEYMTPDFRKYLVN